MTNAVPVVLVVVVGPQAAGKSTVSAALAAELRRTGEAVALVELDRIAAMALPTLPDWGVALDIFESVTGRWVRAGLSCVIAEGVGSMEEVARVRAQAPDGAEVLTVAVTTSLSTAYSRAQEDPSRGVSKEYAFLVQVYDAWSVELDRLSADVVIDSGARSTTEAVALVIDAIRAARTAR